MKPLRQKMINDMKLRRLAPNTQEAYVSAVAGLANHYKQSPDLLDKEKIHAYLLHLMDDQKLSWGTCNVVVSGLKSFYTQTRKRIGKSGDCGHRQRQDDDQGTSGQGEQRPYNGN